MSSNMRHTLLLLVLRCALASSSLCGINGRRLLAVQGNATFVYNDHRATVAWLSEAHLPAHSTGNLSTGSPLVSIPAFKLLEQQWGGAHQAFHAAAGRLFLLGERAYNPNATEAGALSLAVIDTAKAHVEAVIHTLPIVNTWRKNPINDDDPHEVFLTLWDDRLVLAGPTSTVFGSKNFTVFIMRFDPVSASLTVEAAHSVPLEVTELVDGPAQLGVRDALYFLVDRVYSGQRLYSMNLTTGGITVSDIPSYYWSNFVYVPAEHALFGTAQVNVEGVRRQGAHRGKGEPDDEGQLWLWARYDIASKRFTNKTLGGAKCLAISNPEDNVQNIAGIVVSDGLVRLGLDCQNAPDNIQAALGLIDYKTATLKDVWPFAGLWAHTNVLGFVCA